MNATQRNKTDFSQHNLLSQSVLGPLHKTFFELKSPQSKPNRQFDSSEKNIKVTKSIKAKNINDLKLGKHKFLTIKDEEDMTTIKNSNQDLRTSVDSSKVKGLWNDIHPSIDQKSQIINDKFDNKARNTKTYKSLHHAGIEVRFNDPSV